MSSQHTTYTKSTIQQNSTIISPLSNLKTPNSNLFPLSYQQNTSILSQINPQYDYKNENNRFFTQMKRRKINVVEKPKPLLGMPPFPQPTRMPSPNGNLLYSQILQSSLRDNEALTVQDRKNLIRTQQSQGAISKKILDYNPKIIALSETFFKVNFLPHLKDFEMDRMGKLDGYGSAALLIKGISFREISMEGFSIPQSTQVVAIEFFHDLHICHSRK